MRCGLLAVAALLLAGCGGPTERPKGVLRIGHFPNVTHAQALVARHRARSAPGLLEERTGQRIEWYVYNAGPSAMEALLSGALDAAYVGPNPVVNAYLRTRGTSVRVIAGSAEGGSALVVRRGSGIEQPSHLRGRVVATPQFGNSQDVSARAWLVDQGFRVRLSGGDVHVLPTPNSIQLAEFKRGKLDASWTVEPWVSRLELEADGSILVEERDALTTVLVARAHVVATEPDLVRRLVEAHREVTAWIVEHPDEAKHAVRAEIEALTGLALSEALIDRCWPRLRFTAEVSPDAFASFVERARSVGFLRSTVSLDRLVAAL